MRILPFSGLGRSSVEPIALRRLRRMLEADSQHVADKRDQPAAEDTVSEALVEQSQSLVIRAPAGSDVSHVAGAGA